MKKLLLAIVVIALLGVAAWNSEHFVSDPPAAPAVVSTPFVYSDPQFEQYAGTLALTPEGRKVFERANPVFTDAFKVKIEDQRGEYSDGQIKISTRYKGRMDQESLAIVAHEYLHAVWYYTEPTQRAALTASLEAFHQRYKGNFDLRLHSYHAAGITGEPLTSELHSFIGTEVLDSVLPPELIAWYSRWIPNRNALPSYFQG